MTDDELHAEVRALLARMAILSDARGTSYIPAGSSGKKESTGTDGPGSRDGDEDLLTKWTNRFADQANEPRLPTLVLLAGRDLALRTRRKPVQTDVDDDGALVREDAWARDSRIIEWYTGVPAEEAAIMESASGTFCPTNNIRKVRRRNDCDPELGHAQTPREHRQRIAHRLRAEGKSIRDIAREMNVSPRTVQRALEGQVDDLAA